MFNISFHDVKWLLVFIVLLPGLSGCSFFSESFPEMFAEFSKKYCLVSHILYDEKHEMMVAGYESGHICIWDTKKQNMLHRMTVYGKNPIFDDLYLAHGGEVLISSVLELDSNIKNTVKFWDIKTGKLTGSIPNLGNPVCETKSPTNKDRS